MNLNAFNTEPLFDAATDLFRQLGIRLNSNTAQSLRLEELLKDHYKENDTFQTVVNTYFLGLIDDSIFNSQKNAYSVEQALEQSNANYEGLTIFGLELSESPTRTKISELTRAFNRISKRMPVALLLKYTVNEEAVISISISERFKYLQHWRQGEKAGKVIILRDIRTKHTHAGHLRILRDLSEHSAKNFNELHQHWLEVLDVNILNKKFFQELSNWYFAAMDAVSFPDDLEKNQEIRNATNLIRLITRIIFVWFIKEKQLVPENLFDKNFIAGILKDFNKTEKSHSYYNAILQNLFFATLNQNIKDRKFAKAGDFNTNREEYGVTNLFRYADLFTISEKDVLNLFKDIPFLNGGLFDCLDKPNDKGKIEYVDGFSRNPKKQAIVPDYLFFGEEKEIDLNKIYDTKNKRYTFRGLINLLESYKFTVAENTPIEEEVALDPELLGKVFENLLANYNPETQTTARKQTGSFYTPREIVDYMVDESLIEYLKTKSIVSIPADLPADLPADDEDNNNLYTFFNPFDEVDIYHGNLPHWRQDNVWYFVTFRLADSLPHDVVEQIKSQRELWLKQHNIPTDLKQRTQAALKTLSKAELKEYYRLFSERIETLLNAGSGSCVLKEEKIARIVANALRHFNHQRYILDEWVIMPNHVHVLVKPLGNHQLSDILHSWKSFTANEINKQLGRKGQLWMHESYDHIVRNERAFEAIRKYIRENPQKAKLSVGEFLASEQSARSTGSARSMDASNTFAGVRSMDVQSTGSVRSMDASGTFASDTFEARLRDLLSYSDNPNPFNETETHALIEALNTCKILDPACGSGAFPMGILHKMVHILQKLDPNNTYWRELQRQKAIQETEEAFKIGDKAERIKRLAEINDIFENNASDYGRKLYLIENCIYGIDLQPIAVQIAKLRFFISLVIDQKVDKTKDNFGIRSLPNLETKFVAANALIGLEKPTQLLMRNPDIEKKESELQTLRHNYFTATTRKEKLQLQNQDKQLRQQLVELLKKDGWKNTAAQQIADFDPYDQNKFANWFDPEWMFGLQDGFDIVIGNPPYIQLQRDGGKLAKLYQTQHFQTLARTGDIYTLFYEKGLQLLKTDGILCFITSNKWMRAGYGEKLREYFTKFNPLILVDLGPGIFESATVDTNILLIQKRSNQHRLKALTLQKNDKQSIAEQVEKNSNVLTKLTKDAWFIGSSAEQRLKEKIERIGKPLKDWDVKIYRGILTGLNEAFIITTEKRNEILANCKDEAERQRTEALIKRILRGRDIKRYYYEWAGLWVIGTFPALKLNIDDYPALKRYFLDNFDIRQLEQSGKKYPELGFCARKKTGNKWFETQDQIAYYPEFEKEKIVWKRIGSVIRFALDVNKTYPLDSNVFLVGEHIKYLCGYLNSKISIKQLLENSPKTGTGDVIISVQALEPHKIPPITPENHHLVSRIEELVDKILEEKRKDAQADIRQWEHEIDELVYKLYELTEEEVRIVEGK